MMTHENKGIKLCGPALQGRISFCYTEICAQSHILCARFVSHFRGKKNKFKNAKKNQKLLYPRYYYIPPPHSLAKYNFNFKYKRDFFPFEYRPHFILMFH